MIYLTQIYVDNKHEKVCLKYLDSNTPQSFTRWATNEKNLACDGAPNLCHRCCL